MAVPLPSCGRKGRGGNTRTGSLRQEHEELELRCAKLEKLAFDAGLMGRADPPDEGPAARGETNGWSVCVSEIRGW